jgi:hypothetical protein
MNFRLDGRISGLDSLDGHDDDAVGLLLLISGFAVSGQIPVIA